MSYKLIGIKLKKSINFTQGLIFYKNFIYESSGLYNKSKILKTNLDGDVIKEYKLNDNLFAEGLTIFNKKIYLLTYKSKLCLIFDLELNLLDQKYFETTSGEGWGLTHDNINLIVSDGTNYLHYFDPFTFKLKLKIEVSLKGNPINKINDIVFVNEIIYGNIFLTNKILKFNPKTNTVIIIDLVDIKKKFITNTDIDECMNGIAYFNSSFYITGKFWNKFFQIIL